MRKIKKLLIISIVSLTIVISCFILFLYYASGIVVFKYYYFYRNEMVIITANIEAYKSSHNGHPPQNLEEVKQITLKFLEENPNFQEKYLVTSWTNRKMDLFREVRHGYEIGYEMKGNDYYLYLPTHKMDNSLVDQKKLEEIISSKSSKTNHVIIIKNGIVVNGPLPRNNEPFNLNNLSNHLKDLSKFKKPGFTIRTITNLYEKVSDWLGQ
jgi:hypothetical protein